MPSIKLASERLTNSGGSGGGLQPTLINTPGRFAAPSGAGISAPRLNVNAGNMSFTPLQAPEINVTEEWQAAARFSQTLLDETFKFQDRQDQLNADLLVLDYERKQSDQWNGYTDQDGNWIEGASTRKGKEYIDTHEGFVTGSDQAFQELLMNSSESVRQKAFLRMYDVRNTYMTRAAAKKAAAQDYAEEQRLLAEHQQIYKEIEIDPDRGWEQLKTLAGDPRFGVEQKIDMMTKGAVYTTEKIYSTSLREGASKEVAFTKAKEWFEAHRDELPEGAETAVDSTLRQQEAAIAKEKEKAFEKALAKQQSLIEFKGAGTVFQLLVGGETTMEGLQAYAETVFGAFADKPEQIAKVLTDNYKDAFRGLMQTKGYDYARVAFENMKKVALEKELTFGPPELYTDMQAFIDGQLYTESQNMDRVSRVNRKRGIYQGILQAETPEELDAITNRLAEDQSLQAEELMTLNGAAENRKKELNKNVDAATKMIQNTNFLGMRLEAENGLTPDFEERVLDEYAAGNIGFEQSKELLARAEKYTTNQVSPQYKTLKTEIKGLVDLEEMYYDPTNGQVGFWNMLDPAQQAVIKEAQERTGWSDKRMKALAVSSIMDEAERWRKRTGEDYSQFIPTYFSQKPEIKRGVVSRITRNIWNSVGPGGGPAPMLPVESGPIQKEVAYEGYGEAPTGTTPGARPKTQTLNASGLTLEESQATVEGTTVEKRGEVKIAEFAQNSVPEKYKTRYADKDTQWLLALQMVREQRPFIDYYSDSEVENIVNAVFMTPEFGAWLKNKEATLR